MFILLHTSTHVLSSFILLGQASICADLIRQCTPQRNNRRMYARIHSATAPDMADILFSGHHNAQLSISADIQPP
jgi:hypothetical protein